MNTEYKIFNDVYFDRARKYVKNEITQEEVELYTQGCIRKIYGSFEELLFDNIEYYSRIIRTIIWLYENTLVNNGRVITKIDKEKYKIPMTATKFYYICLAQIDFSKSELLYGFPQLGNNVKGNNFQELWKHLLKIGSFAFNVTFSTQQSKTKSYQHAFEHDITDPSYINKILVNSSYVHIDKKILQNDLSNVQRINEIVIDLYNDFSHFEKKNFIIDVRPNKLSYISPVSSEIVVFKDNEIVKTQTGQIDSLFEFDFFLSKQMPSYYSNILKLNNFRNDLNNLKIVCTSMILNYRNQFKAMRISNNNVTYSYITIKKFWNNYKITESLYKNGSLLNKNIFNVGKIHKVANYIIENGYFIFTVNSIEECINIAFLDDLESILNHYTKYIDKTFIDSASRLYLMENETHKIIEYMSQNS